MDFNTGVRSHRLRDLPLRGDAVSFSLEISLFFLRKWRMALQMEDKPGSSALLVKKAHQQKHGEHLSPSAVTSATRSQICKIRKSLPCTLSSLAGGARSQKEPKGSAQKSSLGQTELVWPPLLLETMQNALTQQGKSCTTIHHSLDKLDPGHLPFCLPVVMGMR